MKNLGQATLEALLTLKVILLLFMGSSCIVYLIYAKYISEFYMQKSLLCLESLNSSNYKCKNNLTHQLKRLLFFQKNISVKLSLKGSINKVKVKSSFFGKDFIWSQKLQKQK